MPNAGQRAEAKKRSQVLVRTPAGEVPLDDLQRDIQLATKPSPPPALAQPTRRPVRPSMLTLAESCGYAPTLAEEHPEGTEWSTGGTVEHQAMERAFRDGETPADPGLRAAVETIRSRFPRETRWFTEVKVALVDPDTDERLIPEGTGSADLVGVLPDGKLVIGDWKFGFKPVAQPNENLQILCYGLAKALELGAPAFLPFIWQPNVSGFVWGRWFRDGEDYWHILNRIRAATTMHPRVPVTGGHCGDCYQSSHCSAYLLPAYQGESALEPFTREGGLTHDNAPEALRVVQAMENVIEVAKVRLRRLAEERPIVSGGKEWGPVVVRNGKRTISIDAVPPDLLEKLEAAGAVKVGAPHPQFRWRNVKKSRGETERGGAHDE